MFLGDIKCRTIVFIDTGLSHEYIVGEKEHFEDNRPVAEGINLEDNIYNRFFLCFVADCFDPPLAIVRAEHAQDAIEYFVEECDWSHIDPDMMPREELESAIESGAYGIGPSGEIYDQEQLMVRELRFAYAIGE